MIIVNQDRDMIVNFDNVENIDIVADLDGTGEIPFKIYFETSSSFRGELGYYKTEERAKEVLKEVLKHHDSLKTNIVYSILDKGYPIKKKSYYEMPED